MDIELLVPFLSINQHTLYLTPHFIRFLSYQPDKKKIPLTASVTQLMHIPITCWRLFKRNTFPAFWNRWPSSCVEEIAWGYVYSPPLMCCRSWCWFFNRMEYNAVSSPLYANDAKLILWTFSSLPITPLDSSLTRLIMEHVVDPIKFPVTTPNKYKFSPKINMAMCKSCRCQVQANDLCLSRFVEHHFTSKISEMKLRSEWLY